MFQGLDMAIVRATIEAEVSRIVEDSVAAVDAGIVSHIKRAQREIEERCAFDAQFASTSFSILPATTVYDMPSDFIAMRNLPHYMTQTAIGAATATTNNAEVFLEEVSWSRVFGNHMEEGPPKYWSQSWNDTDQLVSIGVWPLGDGEGPQPGGAYGVVFPYWKRFTTLADGSDSNFVTDNLDDVLAWEAAAMVFSELRDPLANFWKAKAKTRWREFLKRYKRNQLRKLKLELYPTQPLGSQGRPWRREIVTKVPAS